MRFNTSSKSGKNGNSKHGRIPLLIYYYSALWEVSVKYTSGQLKLQWSCLTCSHMENHLFSELISFSYPKCLSISSTIAKRRKKYVLDMRIYVEYTLKRWARGSKKQGSKKNYKKKKKRKKKKKTPSVLLSQHFSKGTILHSTRAGLGQRLTDSPADRGMLTALDVLWQRWLPEEKNSTGGGWYFPLLPPVTSA